MPDKKTSDMDKWIRQGAGRSPATPEAATPEQVAEARKTAGVLGVSVAEALRIHCWGVEPGMAIAPGNAGAGTGNPDPIPETGSAKMNRLIRQAAGR
jgi:hypothetical protein